MRVAIKKLSDQLKSAALERVFIAIRKVKEVGDVENTLRTLLTEEEVGAVVRRMAIAELCERGMSYRKIEKMLGVSRVTVSSVKNALVELGYGKNPNRKKVYSPLREKKKKKEKPLLGYYKGARSVI